MFWGKTRKESMFRVEFLKGDSSGEVTAVIANDILGFSD
jgi:hypothetical protein